jgi:uncharacterized protein (TIGR01777 family)
MKIVVAGGTGFIGSRLVALLAAGRNDVVVLTRDPERAGRDSAPTIRYLGWDARHPGPWAHELSGADAVINLVGESIAGWPWTGERKRRVLESRIHATRAIVQALGSATPPPRTMISASAVNYYDASAAGTVTESSPPGTGFLSGVCVAWEREALPAVEMGVRLVTLRIGIVLDQSQGALARLLLPFRMFVGGPLGSGRQWFPWIHTDDVVKVIMTALERQDLAGPLNLTAPGIVTMEAFSSRLGQVLRRPSWLRVPGFILRLLLGEMSVLVLDGARVVPEKLLAAGYRFRFPELEEALRDALSNSPG